jgi:hypothetical protein
MHEHELVAIWFLSVSMGVFLTMLMPRMVSESRGGEVNQDACKRIPAHQVVDERMGSTILIGKEA